ncbi:MAG TPA: glycine betaine ABC transporter substrate-binding protein [Jiangellaceae bacterium]|nr:glycine betaine ABC transporter substrate-binding protein [Jiangellaceae bacterium]
MRTIARTNQLAGIAVLAAGALTLTACGGDSDPSSGGESKEIEIVAFDGWAEGIAVSHLWQAILEDEGYDAKVTMGGEAGVVYTGIANGDYDIEFDSWLPITHETYIDQHGDSMEDLGYWYDNAKLTIAVNEDAPVTSLDELAAAADQFGNAIVGIEPGAGLTRVTKEAAIPTYGLDGMEFTPSSTPAMLAALKKATDAGENVVVTLWRPHWAYDEFPVRDLEDPDGAMGDAEQIHTYAREGFTEDFPEVADWVGNFWFADDRLGELENLMFNENGGEKNDESARQWLEDNPDFVDQLKAGELKS